MSDSIEEGGAPAGSSTARKSKRLDKVWAHTPMEILFGGAAVVSVGTSVTAMAIESSPVVFMAGALTSVIGPYAYYQQTKLTDIIALKETHEAVKREVDRLQGENVRLNETVGDLTNTMDKLEDVEAALDVITETQGQSVATFAKQVKENRDILDQLHKQLRADKMQNLMTVVLRSDKDGNMHIEEDEIDDLIKKIKKINTLEVMEDRFKDRIMSEGGSLSSVMDIIKNQIAGDVSGEDNMFIMKD